MALKQKMYSYWWLPFVFVLTFGTAATIYTAHQASQNTKTALLERTESLSELLSGQDIAALSASQDDLGTEAYETLKTQFVNIREKNRDIRFIYILGQSPSRADSYFIVDSEDPDSEDYSYPGQQYPEGNEDVSAIYESKQGTVLPITRDRWGVWLSAFSPITNSEGEVTGVLGLDVPANSYYKHVATSATIPFLLTILVLSILYWNRRRARYQQAYLSEKAFFLSFASHEIRSPLTSVSWALQAVKGNTIPEEKRAVFLSRTETSVKHILETIEDVLNMQSTESLKSRKLILSQESIHTLLNLVLDSLSLVAAEKDCEIINKTNPHDYNYLANIDVPLFKRVLSNLLINAMKYSPKNTPVILRFYSKEDGWAIEFHNGGEPISESDQAKIFSGFYRTQEAEHSSEKGTGLGLMLSREIIERHGGTLELESTKETGTTFTIVMPKS